MTNIERKERQLDEREKLLESREEEQLLEEIGRREKDLTFLEEQLKKKEQNLKDMEAKQHAKELQRQEEVSDTKDYE